MRMKAFLMVTTLGLTSSVFAVTSALMKPMTAAPVSQPASQPASATDAPAESENVYTPTQLDNSPFDKFFNDTTRPEWLSRTYFDYTLRGHYTPIAALAMTQPVLSTKTKMTLFQGRVDYVNGSGMGNLGFGYRSLFNDKRMMFGLNAFFDEAFHYNQQRVGVGGEFFTKKLIFRVNYYSAVSNNRGVGISPSGVTTYERALSGYDASFDLPFPRVSWIRYVVSGYRWRGDRSGGMTGGEMHLRVFPARQVEMDVGGSADNANGGLAFLNINYYFSSPEFIENSLTTPHDTKSTFASMDLEKQRLQKVIREDNIVVEKTYDPTSAGKMTVTIGT